MFDLTTTVSLLEAVARQNLRPGVARFAKRYVVYPRYWLQRRACRQGFLEHGRQYPHPVLFIAGMPKSGTTWLERMVASYPGYHELLIPDVAAYELATGGSHDYELPDDIFGRFRNMLVLTKMHVHGSPHNARLLKEAGVPYVVMHRDIRDVAISHYYYVRQTPWHPEYPIYHPLTLTQALDLFAERSLDAFVAWFSSWNANRDIHLSLMIGYEQLLAEPHATMTAVARHFGLDATPATVQHVLEQHCFERLSNGRARGQSDEQSFFRKGVAGDWRNHFTPELIGRYRSQLARLPGGLLEW